MYSSNEYESLELEPKLLISVSALGLNGIKNRRWIDGMEKTVGWLGNGAEGCDFFLCPVVDFVYERKSQRIGDMFEKRQKLNQTKCK